MISLDATGGNGGSVEESAVSVPDSVTSGAETLDQLSSQDREWVEGSLALLDSFFSAGQETRDGFERVLKEHLRTPITVNTHSDLFAAMAVVTGEGVADALLTVLSRGAAEKDLFESFVNSLQADQRYWMRLMMALFGQQVREVWVVGGEDPNNWRSSTQGIFFSLYAQGWWIKYEILKYSGEKVILEGSPKSFLNLVTNLLDMLLDVPADIETEPPALDPLKVLGVVDKCNTLREWWVAAATVETDNTEEADLPLDVLS